MNNDMQQRIKIAVDGYIPTPFTDYIEDHPNKEDLVNLAITMKYWANPEGNYSSLLTEKELKANFDYLQAILTNPKYLLKQQEQYLTDADAQEIKNLVRVKIDSLAEELIQKNNLQTLIDLRIDPHKHTVEKWWDHKTDDEKRDIQKKYDNLNGPQKQLLDKKLKETQYLYVIKPQRYRSYDPLLFYFMCNYMAQLNYQRSWYYGGYYSPTHFGYIRSPYFGGSNPWRGGRPDGVRGLAAVGSVLGFSALFIAAAIGLTYAAKKTYNSLRNIYNGNKIIRSFFRMACMGGGAYSGVYAGVALGSVMGSVVPGIGTFAGGIMGGICVSLAGAGLGAFVGKYTAKLFSSIIYTNEINPTNPEKYLLTQAQGQKLLKEGFDLDIIYQMMKAIKIQKNKIGVLGSFPWTDKRREKNQLNDLLKKVKDGEIYYPIKMGGVIYDPYLIRFEAEKKQSNAMPSSTAVVMTSVIGNKDPQPSTPLALYPEEKDITYQPLYNEPSDTSTVTFRMGR